MEILKNQEKAIYSLRELFYSYGYLPYKMSKFEEYDLYVKNKEFLVSDRIITFTDTSGKLLALKPDVTLSILKNAKGEKQKVCYNETVYRISSGTNSFKEIMQSGIECIGEVGLYDIYESVLLACKSLDAIGQEYVLDLSHLGIVSEILQGTEDKFKESVLTCLAEKNTQGIINACKEFNYQDKKQDLCNLVSLYGDAESVINGLQNFAPTKAVEELKDLIMLLKDSGYYNKINLDFSLTGDLHYYNGIIFKGYINGISQSVLSGGQYDKLAKKLGKTCSAIGFAVYLDLLENYNYTTSEYDVDTLIIYNEKTCPKLVVSTVEKELKNGTVRAQQQVGSLRYKKLIDLGGKQW